MQKLTDRRLKLAFLAAVCLFLSTIEYLIPKPLPFMRLGLANLPILIAVKYLPLPSFTILMLLKILGQNILSGFLFSHLFLLSLFGTLASGFTEYLLYWLFKKQLSYMGLSIAGALTGNLVQLITADLLIIRGSFYSIAPLFLGLGLAASIAIGLFANYYEKRSAFPGAFFSDSFKGETETLC
jgi:heptaprenyl diphosphate synthase